MHNKFNEIKNHALENKSKLLKHFNSNYLKSRHISDRDSAKKHAYLFLSIEKAYELLRAIETDYVQFYECINSPKYEVFLIPKKKGAYRKICAPNDKLKTVQQRLNTFLQTYYYIIKPENVFGFVSNYSDKLTCNIVDNAKQHCQKAFILNIDIKDFFPSIKAADVKKLFMSPVFGFNENISTALTLLTTFEGSLPAGAPTSPAISNFICLKLDFELSEYCKNNDLIFSRYADDLSFSTDDAFSPDNILDILEILKKYGFRHNAKKYRIRSKNSRQMVTGIVVNEKPNLKRSFIKKVRAMIHDADKNGILNASIKHFKLRESPTFEIQISFIRRLSGYLNFIGMVRGYDDYVYLKLKDDLTKCFENHGKKTKQE